MASVAAGPALLRICDLAGRPRGSGFLADDRGTVITSHEAVDGLPRLVLHPPGGPSQVVPSSAVTELPQWNLALIRTPGLPMEPLVIGSDRATAPDTAVRIRLDEWTGSAVTGSGPATYTATGRFHPVPSAIRLELPEAAAVGLRLNAEVTGSPVLDAATGVVLAVLGTALHTAHHGAGLAVPLRAAALADPGGPLAELLHRNGAVVPGFGPDLNLAGALQLTAHSLSGCPAAAPAGGQGGPAGAAAPPVHAERPEAAAALKDFEEGGASVFALVGPPGTGRTSTLAAHAVRRSRGTAPAPTIWLRGAELLAQDTGIRDALGRVLGEAGRVQRAVRADAPGTAPEGGPVGDPAAVDPDVLAHLARHAGRPLLVVLDGPEEMPPGLSARLRQWTAGTAGWLRASGVRLALACRPEYWEHAGRFFPAGVLHSTPQEQPRHPGIALPGCHWLGDLPPVQAAGARAALGIGSRVAPADSRHPLSLRMLAGIRAAQPAGAAGSPGRAEIFAAHLDLTALRLAHRLAAQRGERPGPAGQRCLAARAAARLHEAARRSLGPVILPQQAFEELFPWRGGWARAVLDEGVLLPAGPGYRFTDEEFADWLQGRHLDLDATVERLLGQVLGIVPEPAPAERQPAFPAIAPPPIPRHRIGPVVYALLRVARDLGPDALHRRLQLLVNALDAQPGGPGEDGGSPDADQRAEAGADTAWWARHLLGEVLLRLPDATRQQGVARQLAERVGTGRVPAASFGPWFWRRIALPPGHRLELLRLLIPADPPPTADRAGTSADRYLTSVGQLLAAEPRTVQPLLCRWFDDERPLHGSGGPTVADAAQALLHTHRHRAPDQLTDALISAAHPRADELLSELVQDEPAALCRAVLRWARDDRPARRAAAAGYAPRVLPRAAPEGRALLLQAAEALLTRPQDTALHTTAYRLVLRDPGGRARHLPAALRHFTTASGEPAATAALARALADALPCHPAEVLAAFRTRLLTRRADGAPDTEPTTLLTALAAPRSPAIARRVSALVQEYTEHAPLRSPEPVARFVEERLRHGAAARAVLLPLAAGLFRDGTPALRAALGRVLGQRVPGEDTGGLRAELLDLLLENERDPAVIADVLTAAAVTGGSRELVHRLARLLARTPAGAATADRRLVELARTLPVFGGRLAEWLRAHQGDWAGLVGPAAREELARFAPTPRTAAR